VPRLLLTALACCLALAATACGSQANTYRSQVDTVQKQYQARLKPLETQLATAISDRRTEDAADLAGKTAVVFGQCADAVAAVDPPSHLKARATNLLGAYRSLVTSLRELKTALHANQAKPINRAISRYNAARLDETHAIAALNAA
jgi:hypothetical protein